jgi:hypothetical protein
MDLLECLTCKRRFIVDEAGDGTGFSCPFDGIGLDLVVRGLPGGTAEIEQALNARTLAAASRPEPPPTRRHQGQILAPSPARAADGSADPISPPPELRR